MAVLGILRRLAPLVFVLAASPALAQNFDPIVTTLQAIADAITGPIGIPLGVLAACGVGIMMALGRFDATHGIRVLGGIAIIFGAAAIVDGFA